MPDAMTKDQLIAALAEAFEQFITTATEAEARGVTRQGAAWGPREFVAHLAGWEVMATVRVPAIVAGMPPLEERDAAWETVMNNALNATMVTLIGDQSLATVCGILRQAYQQDIAILQTLDDRFFRPGEYVYERTRGVIEHCQEHSEDLVRSQP